MVTSHIADAPQVPTRFEVTPDTVHVVYLRLDRPFPGATDLLDAEERARATRFVFDHDARQFTHAHAHLRLVLGRALGQSPASLRFLKGRRGKPCLAEPTVDLRFNISHSGGRALIAVGCGREVGIDIEQEKPMEELEFATRIFAQGEIDSLRALPSSERRAAFFRCWTRKEAFIKALGDGLAFPLDQFEVSLERDDSRQLLRWCSAGDDAIRWWRVVSLPSEPGYAAALAAEADPWRIVLWSEPADT